MTTNKIKRYCEFAVAFRVDKIDTLTDKRKWTQTRNREADSTRVALTTNTEDALNGEFWVSFGLSSLKGEQPSCVLRTKISSKIHPFKVCRSFKIINFVSIEAKTQGIY